MRGRPVQPRRQPPQRGSVVHRRAIAQIPLTNGYSAQFIAPANGINTRDLRPSLSIFVRSLLGSPVDVQVEWRRDAPAVQVGDPIIESSPWEPSPVYLQTVEDVPSDSTLVIEPPADLAYRTWYYRARAGNTTTSTWSRWTPQFFLDVRPVLGSVAGYIDANIGVENVANPPVVAYLEMNIGVADIDNPVLTQYAPLNVGVELVPKIEAAYLDLNIYPPTGAYSPAAYLDINTLEGLTPQPHIWWIRPEQGREGFVFNIYGHGFGAFPGEFDGLVKLGDFTCQIASWQIMEAGSPPYEIIRGAGLEPDTITPEHGWIVAIVPDGAISAEVRVVLNG